MIIIQNDNNIFFDVDDTLVMWGFGDREDSLEFDCHGFKERLVPHQEHIKLLKAHKDKGKTIIVWSAGGWEWALEVVMTLKLEEFVDAVMSKPEEYVDDLSACVFMNHRKYIEFKK